jgi:hypothetical protein
MGLVSSGVRAYYRNQRRQLIMQTFREQSEQPEVPLVSTTTPARTRLVTALHAALADACPPDCGVTEADGVLSVGSLLLVEVPPVGTSSSRAAEFAHLGVPTYWLLDPVWSALHVLELKDGQYVETARHTGPVFLASEPFEVALPLEAPV